MAGPIELAAVLGLVLLSFSAVLVQWPSTVKPGLLVAMGALDAPCAVYALITMRYGAGKTASHLISRVGWGMVILFVLLTSVTWMAWDRLQRAQEPAAGPPSAKSSPPRPNTGAKGGSSRGDYRAKQH